MNKHVLIVGGGIVGSTAAFYLSQINSITVTLIDHGLGCATRAAAGIICPWLSQRRNKDWYRLTSEGAAFYSQLMHDLTIAGVTDLAYKQTGTLVFKNTPSLVEKLKNIANERRKNTEYIGDILTYSGQELTTLIPPLKTEQGAVFTSGGGRVDGGKLLDQLQQQILKNGGKIIRDQATLLDSHTLQTAQETYSFDTLLLASGAWLPDLLSPLNYQVDIRPQKGQLIEIDTPYNTDSWPGCMLHGEIDILPFEKGKLVIGATHENDQGYDIRLDWDKLNQMAKTACDYLPSLQNMEISSTRVGTRAYTSDYLPFYGSLTDDPHIWVASGLGSSGLTSGPFIGWQLAQEIAGNMNSFDRTIFSPSNYIKKEG